MKKQWLWGTATSAFQIEGGWQDDGKGESIWDRWNHTENKIHDNSNADIACDHYHLWKSDIELLKQLGVNSYRFSISWPRILPNGGVSEINEKGIEFYSNIIDALLEANIEPFITLYHWDLPQVLQDKFGGWESNEIIDYFVDYAAVCFDRFRGRVKYWTSFNEPYCVVHYGYGLPDSPPGTNSAKSAYLAAHHIILSHAKAYSVFNEKYNSDNLGCFGIVLNSSWYEPKGGDNASEEDKQAQTRSLQFKIDWFAQPIMEGSYPDCMVNLIADLPSFSEDQKLLLKNATDFIGKIVAFSTFIYYL